MALGNSNRKESLRPAGVPLIAGVPVAAGVKAGQFVFASGRNASDYMEGLAPAARLDPALPYTGDLPVAAETKYIYQNLTKVFEAGGSSVHNAVRVNQWIPCFHDLRETHEISVFDEPTLNYHFERWRGVIDPMLNTRDLFIPERRPASTAIPINRLLSLPAHCEVDMVALTDDCGWTKEVVFTDKVPVPKGGYSQAIVAGPWIFLSGFPPTDFKTGLDPSSQPYPWAWHQDKLALETDFILRQQRIVLQEAGGSWDDVVKCQVYIVPEAVPHLPALEQVWRKHFPTNPPARTIMMGAAIGGVRGAWVEIDIVAISRGMGIRKEVVFADQAAPTLGHAPQAIKAGPLLFLSTGLPLDAHGRPVGARHPKLPFSGQAVREQMTQVLSNADAICRAAGGDVHSLVRTQLFFSSLFDLPAAMQVWGDTFGDQPPAATLIEVPPACIVPSARISMDLWACVP